MNCFSSAVRSLLLATAGVLASLAPGSLRAESSSTLTDPAPELNGPSSAHWSLQPVGRPSLPKVASADWPRGAIDHFILRRLESEGLQPASDAQRATLLRRVSFDLIGLPPSPEQLAEFLADPNPDAYSRAVDRLLLSPHFGERWGRHWLDVVRFAESSGGGRSLMYPDAWRYRDYVVEAFNNDKPFDRFIVEQVAGDLLPADDPIQRDQQRIATGMLVVGAINYELQDKELLNVEIADEQIDTVGRAFLGLTLGCARCHDHKFDPISMEEYYGLAGIFLSTKSVEHSNVGKPMQAPLESGPQVVAYQDFKSRLKGAKAAWEQARQELGELAEATATADQDAAQSEKQAGEDPELVKARQEVARLAKHMKQIEKGAPRRPVAMSVVDVDEPSDTHLLLAGAIREHGPVVARCVLAAATPPGRSTKIASPGSGRLELARWIAAPENPLTARVIANRVWSHLFGVGLVGSPDNFGGRGQLPSHPKLLDWLAASLVEDGWSIKSLVRRIVRSRTYQLASEPAGDDLRVDPNNRLLAHARQRRLDVEALRDAMLSSSGQLDLARGGLTIRKLDRFDHGYQYDSVRRSLYVPRFRGEQLGMFTVFDVANPNTVCGRRSVSVLPTQALFMMNSDFLIKTADATAERLLSEQEDVDQRIDLLTIRALGRPASAEEREVFHDYLDEMRQELGDDAVGVWSGLCQLVFSSVDFRYLK